MYGKRRVYEVVQNAPWLLSPWYLTEFALPLSIMLPEMPIANLKESFSAAAAKEKADFTFNNLSPMDYFKLGIPSSSDDRYSRFHDYGPLSAGANLLNSLIGGPEGEEQILDYMRAGVKSPYSPIPEISPVDRVERMFPFGR
jgi:hypothetical protein